MFVTTVAVVGSSILDSGPLRSGGFIVDVHVVKYFITPFHYACICRALCFGGFPVETQRNVHGE